VTARRLLPQLACARRALALRAKMAASSRHNNPANLRSAARTFLSFSLVNAMAQLKFAVLSFRIHIIRNRRSAQPYRFMENVLHSAVQLCNFSGG
jgi:hypothetical protein